MVTRKVVKKKVGEEASVSKTVKSSEEKTLMWFVVIVGIVFALVLIPYFWSESSKTFEFGGIDWVIEDYAKPVGEIFHGRFVSLTNENLNYNVFFRTDPRENDVLVTGKLDEFWSHEAISLSPEVDACRGDLSRSMSDLSGFLRQGVGAGVIESGSTIKTIANETGRKFLTCHDAIKKTVVIVEISPGSESGDPGESGIVQSEVYPSCYTIYAKDCEDSGAIEKFITQSVIDFNS